jgi:hypothetical protein
MICNERLTWNCPVLEEVREFVHFTQGAENAEGKSGDPAYELNELVANQLRRIVQAIYPMHPEHQSPAAE